MKKIIFCGLFLANFSTLFAQNSKAVIDKIVANVGQEIILLSEVEEQYSYAVSRQSKIPDDLRCQILQEIITQKLLVNQARLDSVVVTDEEIQTQVDARFERIVSQMGGDESKFQEFYGVTIDVMRDQVSTDMRSQIVGQKMQQQVMESVNVTPREVQMFFKDIPKDSLPYFNSEVEIREIVVKPTINPAQRQIALDKATDLRNRILSGESLGDLAKKYSEDPGSALANGDLGFVKRGTFVPDFEAAAYNLEPGQISGVVESPFGYHIIKLLERRGNSIHTQHILIKPDITKEDLAATQRTLDSLKMEIEASKITFSEAVKKFGDKTAQSFNNDGRVTNPKSGNTYFELTDLDTDTYFAIDPIEAGKMAPPIQFKDEAGEQFFRLVLLVSRSKPHKAGLKTDYNKIQQACLEQKKASYMSIWMAEKSKTTLVKMEAAVLKDCPELEMLENSKSNN